MNYTDFKNKMFELQDIHNKYLELILEYEKVENLKPGFLVSLTNLQTSGYKDSKLINEILNTITFIEKEKENGKE